MCLCIRIFYLQYVRLPVLFTCLLYILSATFTDIVELPVFTCLYIFLHPVTISVFISVLHLSFVCLAVCGLPGYYNSKCHVVYVCVQPVICLSTSLNSPAIMVLNPTFTDCVYPCVYMCVLPVICLSICLWYTRPFYCLM